MKHLKLVIAAFLVLAPISAMANLVIYDNGGPSVTARSAASDLDCLNSPNCPPDDNYQEVADDFTLAFSSAIKCIK